MVRLEDQIQDINGDSLTFQFLVVRLEVPGGVTVKVAELFQFLVVRLEVGGNNLPACFKKFQFLVVRLEGLTPVFRTIIQVHFNSLWYD